MIDRDPLDELAASFARDRDCPSIAWGVVRDGALAVSGSTGTLDGSGTGPAPDDRTVYRIASMTKSFSAAATLLLRDEGALRLDDPIGDHAPELAHLRSGTLDAPPITIRDLLCMSSGLVTDDAWADRHLDMTDEEFDHVVADGLVFAHPTGACHEYSNFGFALLGRVIHRATGSRLREHVTTRLLDPLGMRSTGWDRPAADHVAPALRRQDGAFVEEMPTPADGMIAPMGGIWTTVADLAIWVSWLAAAFPARDDDDTGPLVRASRREMQTPQRYVGQRTLRGLRFPTSYGYGLRVLDEPGGTVISHSGGLPGYGSNMRWSVPAHAGERGVGVIALSNVTYAPVAELAAQLHDEVRRQGPGASSPPAAPPIVASAAVALLDVLGRWSAGEHLTELDLDAVFADNVVPDEAGSRRAAAAVGHGPVDVTRVVATSAAAGRIEGTSRDGRTVTITFSLSPVHPPRIQEYEVRVSPDAAGNATGGPVQ